jgi:hypothetical protein
VSTVSKISEMPQEFRGVLQAVGFHVALSLRCTVQGTAIVEPVPGWSA